jgi:RNA polymerase-binding transcription factor DksA
VKAQRIKAHRKRKPSVAPNSRRKLTPKSLSGGREDPDIPKRWVWHYEKLSSLRERLIEERKERLHEAAQPLEIHTMSQADSATDEFDHELALSRLSVDQDALYEVEAAMNRILTGKYGICEQTGKPIPPGRLKVLPWTRYCTEVATRLERAGAIAPAQLGRLGRARHESDGG